MSWLFDVHCMIEVSLVFKRIFSVKMNKVYYWLNSEYSGDPDIQIPEPLGYRTNQCLVTEWLYAFEKRTKNGGVFVYPVIRCPVPAEIHVDPFNTGLVQYSDPYCSLLKLKYFCCCIKMFVLTCFFCTHRSCISWSRSCLPPFLDVGISSRNFCRTR
jgi:hypothetical protein